MKKLKLAIIGHGFVGKALDNGFIENVEKLIIDPIYQNSISDIKVFKPDLIFICCPTPSKDDGSINSSLVEECVKESYQYSSALTAIKSTVTPDIIKKLSNQYPDIIYNPEFLTERNANDDFINQSYIILGGNRELTIKLENFYKNYSKCNPKQFHHMSSVEASFVKYGINTFLASKVIFFNQFFEATKKFECDYDSIIAGITDDPRIGNSHTKVPGIDGKRGYGGACFPKDVSAFLSINSEFSQLYETMKINNEYRKNYSLEEREIKQNINFKNTSKSK